MKLRQRRPLRVGLLSFTFLMLLGTAVSNASPITYIVNTTITSSFPTGNPLQTDTVLGSITTDGTIGVIAAANVISWNLNLIDGLNAANDFDLTTANSSLVLDTGNALTANATALSFDFSGAGEFLIQANVPGAFSGFRYFCFSTGVFACAAGETISPQSIFVDGVVATGAAAPIGIQPLDQAPPAAATVPEPGTLSLLALGLARVGVGLRKKKKKLV